jgi:glycosyltransferase involved in cell wall biosynthesis
MPDKINVLMVTGDFPPRISGVGDYSAHITKSLADLGISATVITTRMELANNGRSIGSMDVRYVVSRWAMWEVNKILSLIEKSDPRTVVNIQYYCPFTYGRRLLINFLPLIIRLTRPRARVVVTMHGFWEQSILFRLRALPMLRLSHGVIYVDRLSRALMEKYTGFSSDRAKYIPIASNILPIRCNPELRKMWRQELGFSEQDNVVAFFGGIGNNKGLEYLLEAVQSIRRQKELPVFLLVLGSFNPNHLTDGYYLKISHLIERFGISYWIRIIESPKGSEVSKYLHSADLAVFPFINGVGENSGSMLAALAHGLPTIVTEGPANTANFSETFGVSSVPAMDSERLAECMADTLSSPEKMELMKKKAMTVSKILNWKCITSETLDFYKSLL